MLVRQYVYFALFSTRTPAAEMAAWLGLEPDTTSVRGSRHIEPAVPVSHAWRIECREAGLPVDDQLARLLARLDSHTGRIAELAARLRAEEGESDGGAALQVVRYFNDEDEQSSPSDDSLPEMHTPNLLGWHLGRDVLEFMTATGAVLDVDEYDFSD